MALLVRNLIALAFLWPLTAALPAKADSRLHPAHGSRTDIAAQAPAMAAHLRAHLRDLTFDRYRAGRLLPRSWIVPRAQALSNLNQLARRGPTVTWIGHSTFLLQIGGMWILTDPIFSRYASPLPPLGPRRMAQPGLRLRDLPRIDVVLVSHVHYDHLDFPTLRALAARDKRTVVLGPPDSDDILKTAGFERVITAGAPDTAHRIGPLRFRALRVHHRAGRGFPQNDNDPSVGWLAAGPGARIFFAGDTGYSPVFRQFRRRFGRVDLALVPIGAYRPERFEQHQHVNPEQALQIAADLGARRALGMHWGTFALTPEPLFEPVKRFMAGRISGLRQSVLRIGETVLVRR